MASMLGAFLFRKEWENIRDVIHQLYIVEERSLNDIRGILEKNHGIRATDRTLKVKLAQWGFKREILPADWQALMVLHMRLLLVGQHSTKITIHGEQKTLVDLRRYIGARGMSPAKFLASIEMGAQIPSYIRCYTPWTTIETEEHGPPSPLSSTPTSIDSGICLSRSFEGIRQSLRNPNGIGGPLQGISSLNYDTAIHKFKDTFNVKSPSSCATGGFKSHHNGNLDAERRMLEFLVDQHLKAKGLNQIPKVQFSNMVDQALKAIAGPHVDNTREQVVENDLQESAGCSARRKKLEAHPNYFFMNPFGFSQAHEASGSTSPGVGQSPARSLESRAISEGEMSFAMSPDSDDSLEEWEANLDPELIKIRSHLVQRLVETYTSTESDIHHATRYTAPAEPASSSHGSSNHTSSSVSRTTQTSNTSLGKHKISQYEGDDDQQDEDRPSRRKRTRVTTESISLDGRLLACPYCKHDPIRFSERNIDEKPYRGCSSSYLSTISRLKQHLYRVHRRPEFYCRSCFQVFQTENLLDIHTRVRPSCEPCEPKFAEKMTAEQMASVKRRRQGKTPSDTWFAIFRILFPEALLPESPYADSVSTEAIRAFVDHFQRRAQAILSGLIRELLGSTLVLHSDQQRILDSALESAIAQLVMQTQAPLEWSEIEIQGALNRDMGVPLLEAEVEEPHIPGDSDPFIASSASSGHDDPHNPVTWTPSWGFEWGVYDSNLF